MSQQLDRAGVRPEGSPGLLSYTGQVMLVAEPEIGSTGNERPRKVMISDNPGNYQGKTFRIWAWKEAEFEQLKVGSWVTVHYEVEPNPTPGRNGSNMVSHVEPATATGGGQPTTTDVPMDAGLGEVQQPVPTPQPTDYATRREDVVIENDYDRREREKQARIEARQAFLDQRDDDRTLQMESAWAIAKVLEMSNGLTDDQVIEKGLQLVILKRRMARALSDG